MMILLVVLYICSPTSIITSLLIFTNHVVARLRTVDWDNINHSNNNRSNNNNNGSSSNNDGISTDPTPGLPQSEKHSQPQPQASIDYFEEIQRNINALHRVLIETLPPEQVIPTRLSHP